MAGKQEGDKEGSTAELVALILGRLAGTRGATCREEDVRRVLAKRRRKWRQRHSLRNSEFNPLTPELVEEKQSLMLLCEELKDTLVKRRREAFDRARERRRRRNSLTIGIVNEQLECSRTSLESYQQSHCLSGSGEVGVREDRQDALREQMEEDLLQDLDRNISQAKALSDIQQMKLHMTPHNLSQWSPTLATPGPSLTSPPEQAEATTVAERDGQSMAEPLGGGEKMSPPESRNLTAVAERDGQSMADPLGGGGEVIMTSPPEQAEGRNLTAVAERDDQMADPGRDVIVVSPPEQEESTAVAERDGKTGDSLGGGGEVIVMSQAENRNLTAVAERDGQSMADPLGGRGEMSPPEQAETTSVAERDGQKADPLGGGREIVDMSPPESNNLTAVDERDGQSMADPLVGGGEMSPPEQVETTSVAERDGQKADPLGGGGEIVELSPSESNNLTAVAERDDQSMADPLGGGETSLPEQAETTAVVGDSLRGGREMSPPEQAESRNLIAVAERDGQSTADPLREMSPPEQAESTAVAERDGKTADSLGGEGEIIEMLEEVGGEGEEILCEDKVPDVARVVEGTTEELNDLCSIQRGLEGAGFVHQTGSSSQSEAGETENQQESALPHKNGLVTYDMCGGGEVTVLEGETNEEQNPAVGCEMEINELSNSSLDLEHGRETSFDYGKKNDKLEIPEKEKMENGQKYSNGQVGKTSRRGRPPGRRGRKRKLRNSSVVSPGDEEAECHELCRKVVETLEVFHSSVKPKRPRGRPPKKRVQMPHTTT